MLYEVLYGSYTRASAKTCSCAGFHHPFVDSLFMFSLVDYPLSSMLFYLKRPACKRGVCFLGWFDADTITIQEVSKPVVRLPTTTSSLIY